MDEELKEDPCLIDAIESEVNGALKVLKKAELGEKVEYATDQHQRETAQIQVQLPNHYFVADEIKQHPNEEQRTVVIVRDDASKTADVVLPQGASLEVNNEIKGMNKQRFTKPCRKRVMTTCVSTIRRSLGLPSRRQLFRRQENHGIKTAQLVYRRPILVGCF